MCSEQKKGKENFTLCLDVWNITGKNCSTILKWIFRNFKTLKICCLQTLKRRVHMYQKKRCKITVSVHTGNTFRLYRLNMLLVYTQIKLCLDRDFASFLFSLYTGCPRRNVKYFGRVFLMLNYTDITQNTYIQSWTVTELMAREKCGLLWCPRTVRRPWRHIHPLRKPGKEIS